MTTINIGTNKGNITNIEIEKPFKEICYQDIVQIVKSKVSNTEKINIQGWANVSHTTKNKLKKQ